MGRMHVLGPYGDIVIEWDESDQESVRQAEQDWKRLKDLGYEFINPEAKTKRRLKNFRANLGRVLAIPGVKKPEDKKKGTRKKAMAGGPNTSRITGTR